jgi:uncharacterized protein
MSSADLATVARPPALPTPPALPAPPAPLPRTWKFLGTALWGTAAFLAMTAGQLVAVFVAVAMSPDAVTEDSIKAIAENGAVIAASVMFGVLPTLLVLWLATRLARRSFASYLALRWPRWQEIAFAVATSTALLVALDSVAWLAGYPLSPDFALDSVRTARDGGLLWLVMLGFCTGAPLAEEFIFRGFVFRGWSVTWLRPVGAIILSSALFAVIHQQYDWFYIGGIFLIGALLGYLRHRSGSTWLTVITHSFYNLMASLQALWFIS